MPRVIVLYNQPVNDGEPSEVGVIREVEDVRAALESQGFDVERCSITKETLLAHMRSLETQRKEVAVFNLSEGLDGQARHEPLVAGLLELHGLRFTGSPSATLGWALDKRVAKALLRASGVETPDAWVVRALPAAREVARIDFPVIVKPVREDGSLGITAESVVNTADELRTRIARVLETYRQPALVERFLPGREFNVAVTGEGEDLRPLPLAEIAFQGFGPTEFPLVSHAAKWNSGSRDDLRTVPTCPAVMDGELRRRVEDLALATCRVFECRDYARIDIRLDDQGSPFVIDVNPNPDISRTAGLARAVRVAGIPYEEFITTIMEAAWKRPQ